MKKLKLDLDELKVASFETDSLKKKTGGTVYGNVTWTEVPVNCTYETCWVQSCFDSCIQSCAFECHGTAGCPTNLDCTTVGCKTIP